MHAEIDVVFRAENDIGCRVIEQSRLSGGVGLGHGLGHRLGPGLSIGLVKFGVDLGGIVMSLRCYWS